MSQEQVVLSSADGLRLEGRLISPEDPVGGAVLCHPHPLYGGSMSSILIPTLQRAIAARGWAALRFNYRGVGRSEGVYDHGIGETRDVVAALETVAAAAPGLPLAVVGWSFGAMTGLRAAGGDDRIRAYVGIAPPVSVPRPRSPVAPAPERLAGWGARALVVTGTEDAFCRPDDLRSWIGGLVPEARVEVIDGEDHMFSNDRARLAALVADFLTA